MAPNTTPLRNLTDPMEIKHALERKLGHGAQTIFAETNGFTLQHVNMNIRGERNNEAILGLLAQCIGQPVHGVAPLGGNSKQFSN
jgi:hypothetical protein